MNNMTHREDHVIAPDGLELYAQHWLPEGLARANLIVVHGIGEHSGRYGNVVDWFAPRGYALHSFDHRGHGRSPGQRGYIQNWSDFREDLRAYIRDVEQHYPGAPTVLLGHSMGGLIVLDYGLHYGAGLKALVASAPPLTQSEDVSPLLTLAARLLSPLVPKMSLKTGLSVEALSRDAAVVAAYQADPLVHGLATPRLGAEIDRTMKATLAAAPNWPADLPLLIVHGGADKICPPVGSRRFFETAGAKDKTRHEYPGFYHEVFNEIGKEQVLTDVQTWLEARL